MEPQLTLGPILFHWPMEKWRDFYFKIADEAPVDVVYVGEVVCSKRAPFYEPLYNDVAQRLKKAGKRVVFSTLSEVMIKRDRKMVEELCALENTLVEANDNAALWHLSNRPHAIGPFLNVYNEDTLAFLAPRGAEHVCFPPELPSASIAVMAKKANELVVTTEVQVYGRMPLALSARCYHARAHGRVKDNCQFVCEKDPDGMDLKTLEGKPFLTVNGIQTMSHTYLNLIQELHELKNMGVTHFRISPHSHDMVEISQTFRSVIDNLVTPDEALERLEPFNIPFANGFYHKRPGYEWIRQEY